MLEKLKQLKPWAPVIVRIGISLVYLWFGINQLVNPGAWISWVPDYAVKLAPFPVTTLVLINGGLETILGFFLFLGLWTRIVAGILSLHALHLLSVVGYGAIGTRDFGIMMAIISVFLNGPDVFSFDDWRASKALRNKNTELAR